MLVKDMLKVLEGLDPDCKIVVYDDGNTYEIEAVDLEEATKDQPECGPVFLCVNTPHGPVEQARIDAEDQ